MPTSCSWGKEQAAQWCVRALEQGKTKHPMVVDVGAGEGTWVKLLRPVAPTGTLFVAFEIWGPYTLEYDYASLYDSHRIADIRVVDPVLFSADLVIFGDVLEHMPKHDARHVLRRATRHSNHVLVCNPVRHCEFEGPGGNPYDGHKLQNLWSEPDMDDLVASAADMHLYPHVKKHVGDIVGYWMISRYKDGDC